MNFLKTFREGNISKQMNFSFVKALTLLLLIPFVAAAQDGNPENWCRNGFFANSEEFRLAKVVGAKGARVYFYSDDDDCPNASLAKCKKKSYLVTGDKLIVSKTYNNFACGWFQPMKGSETVAWLPIENLEITKPDFNPAPTKWLGTWRFYDNSITIKSGGAGNLKISGEAFWKGLGDNIHTGEIGGSKKPKGNQITLEDEICKVTLTLIGDYLIANDNSECGGANVTFDGVYRLKKKR
jgi:hypothetical protein